MTKVNEQEIQKDNLYQMATPRTTKLEEDMKEKFEDATNTTIKNKLESINDKFIEDKIEEIIKLRVEEKFKDCKGEISDMLTQSHMSFIETKLIED